MICYSQVQKFFFQLCLWFMMEIVIVFFNTDLLLGQELAFSVSAKRHFQLLKFLQKLSLAGS